MVVRGKGGSWLLIDDDRVVAELVDGGERRRWNVRWTRGPKLQGGALRDFVAGELRRLLELVEKAEPEAVSYLTVPAPDTPQGFRVIR